METPKEVSNMIYGYGTTTVLNGLIREEKKNQLQAMKDDYQDGIKFHGERLEKLYDAIHKFWELEEEIPFTTTA